MLIMTIFELVATFFIHITGWILNIVSVILFIVAVFIFFNDGWRESVTAFVIAWAISPLEIPAIAQLIVDSTVLIRNGIRRIYS